jgi:hypothetical protein
MATYEETLKTLARRHEPRIAVAALVTMTTTALRGLVVTGNITAEDARDLLMKCCDRISDARRESPNPSREGS